MNDWWHGIWNDPMNENPWALGALLVIIALIFVVFEIIYRRRKQETMEPTDPTPITSTPTPTATGSSEWTGQLADAGAFPSPGVAGWTTESAPTADPAGEPTGR